MVFQAQEMHMEAMAPPAALPMMAINKVQSAVRLLGDATQYHSSLRRKAITQHLAADPDERC